MGIMKNEFFNEQAEQSLVKSTIVKKYFWVWANVILSVMKKKGNSKIAYIDLFSGPGRYKDGASSTPIMILESAINDQNMCESLITIFNDKDEKNSQSLELEISKIPNIQKLKNKPSVLNNEIGTEIVKQFEQMRLVPTLLFFNIEIGTTLTSKTHPPPVIVH
ncbi:MAG: three-Cys-motif partner protein TcmP [Anaerolineae bacterium]|nr:three-Cys-motif partner protein TcmP [Anaerolineae bacterium]